MASCLGKKRSSSVYLLAPHGSPGLSSCDEVCSSEPSPGYACGDDLDHSRPTEWLNDLVRDQLSKDGKAVKSGEKPLHAGDIAAIERTLQVSSCALIVGLMYAERLKVAESSSAGSSTVDGERPEHTAAPAPSSDRQSNELSDEADFTDEQAPGDHEDVQGINVADLFLMCVLTANKYLYDEGEPDSLLNGDLALAGRRKTRRVNELERIFLRRIGWRLHVSQEDFASFLQRVERLLSLRAFHQSGQLHYQDADRLWSIVVAQGRVALAVLLQVTGIFLAMYGLAALVILLGPLSAVSVWSNTANCTVHSNASFNLSAESQPLLHSMAHRSSHPSSDTWTSPFAGATLDVCHSCAMRHRQSATLPASEPVLSAETAATGVFTPLQHWSDELLLERKILAQRKAFAQRRQYLVA